MNRIKTSAIAASLALMCSLPTQAQEQSVIDSLNARIAKLESRTSKIENFHKRFTIGGYGEAVMSRNFYSDNIYRYTRPYEHKDDDSHGRFDLPHVVINLGYDFGKGWSMGMEVEFEHGGTESAVEMDADESGEYEAETEKGGEVALEQFWLNYAFNGGLNIKAGEIIVPVGAANAYHMPNEFFTVYRPEGEATLFPNTWHQVGVSVWGKPLPWVKYEAEFLSGLDSERFGSSSFVHYGATSPYEFKIANTYAGAFRTDFYPLYNNHNQSLRLSASGYFGRTFRNTLHSIGNSYQNCKGDLYIGAFDFLYKLNRWAIVRGNIDYAYLSDATQITSFNKNFPTHTGQDGSPSKHQPVAKNALCYAAEGGLNLFGFSDKLTAKDQTFYLFGRYEYYNSMESSNQSAAYGWCGKKRFVVGLNYSPIKQITIKAEYSKRFFDKTGLTYITSSGSEYPLEYNSEPSLNIGITYYGWFK